jgi:transposase-like protein
MTCSNCCLLANRFGKDRKGYQRFRCPNCGKTFTQSHNGNVHGMYTGTQKAETVLRLLVEGNSIRKVTCKRIPATKSAGETLRGEKRL